MRSPERVGLVYVAVTSNDDARPKYCWVDPGTHNLCAHAVGNKLVVHEDMLGTTTFDARPMAAVSCHVHVTSAPSPQSVCGIEAIVLADPAWKTGGRKQVVFVCVKGEATAGYVLATCMSEDEDGPFATVQFGGTTHDIGPRSEWTSAGVWLLKDIVGHLRTPKKSECVISLRQMSDRVVIDCIGAVTLLSTGSSLELGSIEAFSQAHRG